MIDAPKVAVALAGLVVGWAGTALTLTGRVSAIEATLVRIEARLDRQAPTTTVINQEK